jgi:hypothetical protein
VIYFDISGKELREIANDETFDACNFDRAKLNNGRGTLPP